MANKSISKYAVENQHPACISQRRLKNGCMVMNVSPVKRHFINIKEEMTFYQSKRGNGMDIGQAVYAMRNGYKVRRTGWRSSGQFLELQKPEKHSRMKKACIVLSPVDRELVQWVATQADLLADDWVNIGTLNP